MRVWPSNGITHPPDMNGELATGASPRKALRGSLHFRLEGRVWQGPAAGKGSEIIRTRGPGPPAGRGESAVSSPAFRLETNPVRTLIIAAAAALLLAPAAHAEIWEFPSNRPLVSVDVPDGWTADESETGLDLNADDGSIYMGIDIAAPKKTEDVVGEAIAYLAGEGITIDETTEQQSEAQINGRDTFFISWSGEDQDGPASIGLAAMVMDEKTVLVFTYWGTKGDEDAHEDAIAHILDTIRPVR